MSHASPPTATTTPRAAACRVVFGRPESAVLLRTGLPELALALPLLAGPASEEVLANAAAVERDDGTAVFRSADRVAGLLLAPAGQDLERAAESLYQRVFAATGPLRLYRIWNYVPRINAVESGLENYRRFCRGRSHAFEAQFGRTFQRQLPAASAVGASGGTLAVAFLAGRAAPQHFENPQQVPAFEYPTLYGPRPPSFSRATRVADGSHEEVFISGTAAIRGHATVAADDLAGQLRCTRDNLLVIAATAGVGRDFGAGDWQRTFKVYIRHAADLGAVRSDLESHVLRPGDTATYLHADLCRSDLLVEIEAVLTRKARTKA